MAGPLAGRRVAVVTGRREGIGWANGRALADEGCKVDSSPARRAGPQTSPAASRARRRHRRVRTAGVGTRPETSDRRLRRHPRQLGPIDLVLAKAGVGRPTPSTGERRRDVEEMFG